MKATCSRVKIQKDTYEIIHLRKSFWLHRLQYFASQITDMSIACAGILTLNVDKNLAHPRHGHLWSPYSGKIFAAATLHYKIDTRTWQSIASICCRYKLKRIFSDAVSSLTGVLKSTQRNNMSPSSEKTSVFRICWWQSARNTSSKLSVLSMGSRP